MKNKLIKYSALLFSGILLLSRCTKKFQEINTNPASYNQANFNPNFLLTTAQVAYTGSFDFAYDIWRANLIYSSTLIQGFSTVLSYWGGDKYKLSTSYAGAYWGFSGDGAYGRTSKPYSRYHTINHG